MDYEKSWHNIVKHLEGEIEHLSKERLDAIYDSVEYHRIVGKKQGLESILKRMKTDV